MAYRTVLTLALLSTLVACAGTPSKQPVGNSDAQLLRSDPQVYDLYEAMGLLYPLHRVVAYAMFDAAEANPVQKPLYHCMIKEATPERIVAQIAPTVRSVFTDAELERAVMFFNSSAGQKYRPRDVDMTANLTKSEYRDTLAFKSDFDAKFEALHQPEFSRTINAAIKPVWNFAFNQCVAENRQTHDSGPPASAPPKDACEKVEVPFGGKLIDLNREGIGLVVAKEAGAVLIKEVVPGGPVHRTQAVAIDDEIFELSPNADGVFLDAGSVSLPDLIRQLRGCPGSPVALRMKRGDDFYDIKVRRERTVAQ